MEDILAGLIVGVIIGKASEQHRHPPQVHYPPVVVVQPHHHPHPRPQVPQVIYTPGLVCPQGLAPMYETRYDAYARPYHIFIGCR